MTERKKTGIYLKDNIWANDRPDECAEPNDKNKLQYPITENDGWGTPFSEAGGNPVERKVMNRNFNKIGALAYDVNRFGSNLPWEASIAYEVGALVIGSDNKTYRAAQASTGVDPAKDNGTNWKFAVFNSITGTENIKVTADAKNNLIVNTAVNLKDKADIDLKNVATGTIKGKFADTSTIKVDSNDTHVSLAIKTGTIDTTLLSPSAVTAEKVNGTDKKSWAAKLGESANQAETMVKRDGQGIARFFRVGIDSEDSKYDFGYIASVDGNKNTITTSVSNAKRVFGIDALTTKLTATETKATKNATDITALTPKVTKNVTDIAAVAPKVTTNTNNIASVQKELASLKEQLLQLNRQNRIIADFATNKTELTFKVVSGATGSALIRAYGARRAAIQEVSYATLTLKLSTTVLRQVSIQMGDISGRQSSGCPYFEYIVAGLNPNTSKEGYSVTLGGSGPMYYIGYSVIPY